MTHPAHSFSVSDPTLLFDATQMWRLPPFVVQTVFPGSGGNDMFVGSNKADTFNMADGGDDSVSGGKGNDTFNFGATLTAADTIDGGQGNGDKVTLAGDYTGANALAFGAATMVNVEKVVLADDNYALTMNNANVAGGTTLTIDGSALTSAHGFTFDGTQETTGSFTILGGSSNATLTGGAGGDTFEFGGGFRETDRIDGRGGADTLLLDGDYSAGLVFEAATIRNVETIALGAGHDYFMTLDNSNVLLGQMLTVSGDALGAGRSLVFDGSAETSSVLHIAGGAGNDTLVGGGASDQIATGSGADTVNGEAGDDTILAGAGFDAADAIDGGAGKDTLRLDGNYIAGITLADGTIQNIEKIVLADGNSYGLTLAAGTVDFGDLLTVDGSALDENAVTINGAAVEGRLHLLGGGGADIFTLGQSGADTVSAGDGSDVVIGGANFTADERLDAGAGTFDTLALDGDYSDRLEFASATLRHFEFVTLAPGHSYNLATADGNVAAGETLTVNATALAGANMLTFDGSKETNGAFVVTGGAGDDTIIGGAESDQLNGGAGNDSIDATHGGSDAIDAGDGTNTILMGAALDSGDVIAGGTGTTTLFLDGDYSNGATLNVTNISAVELAAGHSYFLSINSTTDTHIDGTSLGANDFLSVDGTAAGSRVFANGGSADDTFQGGAFNDFLSGGGGNDQLDISQGGNDLVGGDDGDDTIVVGAAWNSTDTILGGNGSDTLMFNGAYGGTLSLSNVQQIENIIFQGAHSYTVLAPGIGGTGALTANAVALGVGNSLNLSAAGRSYAVVATGGAGNDTLTGGTQADTLTGNNGNDVLTGNGGKDMLNGGAGVDTFVYLAAADSTGVNYDTIIAADFLNDKIDTTATISAIGAAYHGSGLSFANFDSDLATAMNSTHGNLLANNAMYFQPSNGDLSGHLFLVVDLNNTNGFQLGNDLLIDVSTSSGSLDTGDFV